MPPVPAIYIPQPGDVETLDKMVKLRALADAIARARVLVTKEKTRAAAEMLSSLQQQRAELRATLPQLRIVT